MKHRKANASFIPRFFLNVLCLTLVFVTGNFRVGLTQSPKEERKINIRTFYGMPLKVKEIRNLQKEEENWFRDLEIEVENISDKPIYYVRLVIEFPDIHPSVFDPAAPPDSVTGMWLAFGPPRLGDIKNLATPDDISLKPGETYVFKITEGWAEGFESIMKRPNVPPQAMDKMKMRFAAISFGDGTGYSAGEKRVYQKKKNGDELY